MFIIYLQLMKRAYLCVFEMVAFIKVCLLCIFANRKKAGNPACKFVVFFISTRVHQWSGGTDGRTDTVLIGSSVTLKGSATC